MNFLMRTSLVAALLAAVATPSRSWAADGGQEDLNRATEVKLNAKTVADLTEVVRLVESSLEKGLDEEQAQFARSLLAAALIQRGSNTAKMVILSLPRNPNLAQHRKAALADIEKGLKLSPEQSEALYLVARLNLLPDGDAERALEALGQVIELSTDRPPLRARALMLRASVEKDPKKKMADLDEAVRTAPDDPVVVRTRGLLRADLGKLEEALPDLDKAIELAPKQLAAYEAKAIVLTRLKRYDEALVSLDKAHELSPNSALPLLQKARIHGLQSNLDAALHELDRAQAMHPKNVAVLLLRAGVYRDMDNPQKATADIDRALKIDPKSPAAMRLLAVFLIDDDKPDEAIAQLEQLRRVAPKDMLALMQLARIYLSQKKYDKAAEACSGVLAEHPNQPLALRGRADALLNLGKHKLAIADYEVLMKQRPDDPGTLNNLAWVLATSPIDELRDGKRAVELAHKACELTQYKAGHNLSTLAGAYAETGDFKAALKWIDKGLEVAEDDVKEPLTKERKSYVAGKPWRESLSAEEPQESPDEKPQE